MAAAVASVLGLEETYVLKLAMGISMVSFWINQIMRP